MILKESVSIRTGAVPPTFLVNRKPTKATISKMTSKLLTGLNKRWGCLGNFWNASQKPRKLWISSCQTMATLPTCLVFVLPSWMLNGAMLSTQSKKSGEHSRLWSPNGWNYLDSKDSVRILLKPYVNMFSFPYQPDPYQLFLSFLSFWRSEDRDFSWLKCG